MTGVDLRNGDSKVFVMDQSHVSFIIWVKYDPYLTRTEVLLWMMVGWTRFVQRTEDGMISTIL